MTKILSTTNGVWGQQTKTQKNVNEDENEDMNENQNEDVIEGVNEDVIVDKQEMLNFNIKFFKLQLNVMEKLNVTPKKKTIEDILKIPSQFMRVGKRKRQELCTVMSPKNYTDQCEVKDQAHAESLIVKKRKTDEKKMEREKLAAAKEKKQKEKETYDYNSNKRMKTI